MFQAGIIQPKDDRPTENLSYAAANLVKPNLASKRQQSEPPLNRNVFPPTPPPEGEKPSGPAPMSRGASVRNGPKPMPAKLNIEKARPNEGYEIRERDDARSPPDAQQRRGTQRTASEPRGPSQNQYPSRRSESRSRQPPPRRMQSTQEEDDDYPDDLYDMYSSPGRRSNNSRRNTRNRNIEEESEYASEYDEGSFDEDEFEMVSNRPPPKSRTASSTNNGNGRAGSRQPDIRKIRVKVHAEDVRYIMISSTIDYRDFQDKIKEKFAMRDRFKIKVRDDDVPNGDMITMGDQDDLDMVLSSVKANARRERLDMGKMEVSHARFYEPPFYIIAY